MKPIEQIQVFGVGGVGGYFGGKLALAFPPEGGTGPHIGFVARGAHLEAIRDRGLVLDTGEQAGLHCRPSAATEDPASLPPPDLCILAVKAYDLKGAVESIRVRDDGGTVVLPLLNGIDIYDRVKSALPRSTVLPACAYVGTHIREPGVVAQKGGSCTIHLGPDPADRSYDPAPLKALFDKAAIKYRWDDRPEIEIWTKYIFIAAHGLVTAAENVPLGEVVAARRLTDLTRQVMEEIAAIAARKAVPLPADIVEVSLRKAAGFPYETRTSYQRDVEQGTGRDEGELFGGAILRLGAELGVDTPATASLYRKIRDARREGPR